jgi:hypothetical protein
MPESHNAQSDSATPELSVILVFGRERQRAARALGSILSQSLIDRMEILLFDLGPENVPPVEGSDHPRVKMTRTGPDDLISAARVRGVRAASAPVVSFMEEHCEMQPGWAQTIVETHREPWAAVGSDLINGNPGAGCSDLVFRVNYGIYVRPNAQRGPIHCVAGENSAFKREILLRYEKDLEQMFYADLVLQWKIAEDGYAIFYEPAVQIAHKNENTFRSLATGLFYFNWCFANVRAHVFRWSIFRRAVWIALSPLVPWVRLAKMSLRVLRAKRVSLIRFLRDVPFILAANYFSTAGQVAGLLNPIDRAARKISNFEMNEPRLSRTEWTQ